MSLASSTHRATIWSGADSALRAIFGFAITVVLARLVSPAEFGLMAIVLVFSAVANVFVDSGLSTALIQRQDVGRREESTVFLFNIIIAFVVALALSLCAPLIASFFVEPELEGITRLMAVGLVIGALGSIHTTLLVKTLNFRPLTLATFWSWAISGGVAVLLASNGYGAWSLAWQVVVQVTVSTVLLWVSHRWRPEMIFDRVAFRGLFSFGFHVMAANIVDSLYTRVYSVVIGKIFSTTDLGFYTRAQSTQQLPTTLLTNMLNRVALPAFSRTATDKESLQKAFAKASRMIMFVNLPLMAGLAVTAEPLVVFLFGARWLPVVPLLQVLCLVGAVWPLQVLNVSALLAQGHSRLVLRLEFIKKGVGVLALVVASRYGLLAIAWSQVATAAISYVVNCFYTGRLLEFGAISQLRVLLGIFVASFIMVGAVWLLGPHIIGGASLQLVVLVPVAAAVYLIASAVFGLSHVREFSRFLRLVFR